MNKKILAIVMTLCLLFGMLSIGAGAALVPTVDTDIPVEHRFCPGTVINEDNFPAPSVSGKNIYSQGWEIKLPGKDWAPYENIALKENDNGASLRYYVSNRDGGRDYSNECVISVRHNPQGKYTGNSMEHWKICADCGERCEIGTHTTMGEGASSKNQICEVCGQRINKHFLGLLTFIDWVMALIGSLIPGMGG